MGDGSRRAGLAAVLTCIAVAAGVAAGLLNRAPAMTRPPSSSIPMAVDVTVEVHVAGWVVSPGVVTVDEGAIVAEAVEAAGGLRPGANSASLNLAAPVGAGDQIVVPGPEGVSESGGETSDGLISLNRATASELETLPGVGPVLAERIIEYREDHGRLETVEDLLDVPGIGESKLASLRDLVRP